MTTLTAKRRLWSATGSSSGSTLGCHSFFVGCCKLLSLFHHLSSLDKVVLKRRPEWVLRGKECPDVAGTIKAGPSLEVLNHKFVKFFGKGQTKVMNEKNQTNGEQRNVHKEEVAQAIHPFCEEFRTQ